MRKGHFQDFIPVLPETIIAVKVGGASGPASPSMNYVHRQ